jgi:hypothetical protein
MSLYAHKDPTTGLLSNISDREPVDANDVPLAVMPTDYGPWTYDSVNHLAVTVAARVPRTLYAIRADLVALSTANKNAVWAALIAGTPPLWATASGPNAAALAAIQLFGASATLSAADVLEAKLRAAAMYAQDQPNWLVNPAFAPTVNVPGDQLA